MHSLKFTLSLAPIPPILISVWQMTQLWASHTPRGKKKKTVSFHNLNLKTPYRSWPVTTWFICPSPRPLNIGKDKQNAQLSLHQFPLQLLSDLLLLSEECINIQKNRSKRTKMVWVVCQKKKKLPSWFLIPYNMMLTDTCHDQLSCMICKLTFVHLAGRVS